MKRHRRKHTADFKARVAIEAIRGIKTMSEIAAEFEIHPVMVSNWKKEMLEHLPEIFENKNAKKDKASSMLFRTQNFHFLCTLLFFCYACLWTDKTQRMIVSEINEFLNC